MAPGPIPTALGAPFNELTNPSFELGLDRWRSYFTTQAPSIYSSVELTTDWFSGRGDVSARWRGADDGGSIGGYTSQSLVYGQGPGEQVPAVPGDKVGVSFDWLCEAITGPPGGANPQVFVSVSWLKADGTLVSSTSLGATPLTIAGVSGRFKAVSAVAPALTASCFLFLSVSNSQYASTTFLIDNVTAVKNPAGGVMVDPFDGRSAGKGWEGEPGASRSGTGTAFADPFVLHPRAGLALASLPPVLQEDPDVRAVVYAQAREAERQEAQLDDLLAQLDPARATEEGLTWFETLLNTTVSPPGKTVAQRRATVVNRMSRVAGEPAGSGWETAVAEVLGVLGTDWDYAEFVQANQRLTNMIHNPKAVTNGFGVLTWWGGGYSNGGATTTMSGGSDAEFFGQGLRVQVNTSALGGGGGTSGDSTSIASGIMSVLYNDQQWYGFRCEYRLAASNGYGLPQLGVTFSNLSAVVRGTATPWIGLVNLDTQAGSTIWTIEGRFKQPTVGAADTRRLVVSVVLPVIATGAGKGTLDITLGRFICVPLGDALSPMPDYFDGDTDHFQWANGIPDNDTSQTRTSTTADTTQLRVPYSSVTPDPKIDRVRDLTASHLDIETLYSETI